MAVYTPATEAFTVSILGESTKQTWAGEFRIKTKLSWRDQMQMDKARRELLGPDPQGATPDTIAQAVILAELGARIVEAPAWWTESRGGLDFYDSDVITGIYEKVRKLVLAEEKGSDAEGEQARKDLKAVKEAAEKAPVVKGNRKPLPVE